MKSVIIHFSKRNLENFLTMNPNEFDVNADFMGHIEYFVSSRKLVFSKYFVCFDCFRLCGFDASSAGARSRDFIIV